MFIKQISALYAYIKSKYNFKMIIQLVYVYIFKIYYFVENVFKKVSAYLRIFIRLSKNILLKQN